MTYRAWMHKDEFDHYRIAYYETEQWKSIRRITIFIQGRACSICGKDDQPQVHHRTYARFGGNEQISDLIVLCGSCHKLYELNKGRSE